MRYTRLAGPKSVEIVDVPTHAPGAGQVLIEIAHCGVGGSDRNAWTVGSVGAPAWFGHEWSGRVAATGAGVSTHFEGQRVVAGVSPACGVCALCRVGRTLQCRAVLEQIVGLDELSAPHGGFATHTVADARRIVPLLDAISLRDGALVEPAAVAAHAIARSGLRVGDVAVVVGSGTVGLLTSELARLAGATHVVSVDTSAARNELACDLGADAAFTSVGESLHQWLYDNTGGVGADVVFACVDTADALAGGLSLVSSGGTIVAVGVGDRIDNLSVTALLSREADFRISLGYTIDDLRRVQSLMEQDRLRVRPLLQPPAPLDDLQAVFERGVRTTPGPPKVLIEP